MSAQTEQQLKENLEKVIRECFKRAEEKKFKELNFAFNKEINKKKYLDKKIIVLKNLDIYSQTFLSIHTRAKVALREFQEIKFDGAYLELLRLVLTLHDNLGRKKSVKVYEKSQLDEMEIGNEITVVDLDIVVKPKNKNGVKFIRQGVTGKKIMKRKNKEENALDEVMYIEL